MIVGSLLGFLLSCILFSGYKTYLLDAPLCDEEKLKKWLSDDDFDASMLLGSWGNWVLVFIKAWAKRNSSGSLWFGGSDHSGIFTIFLKIAKVLMWVITTVFFIFALLFVLAGNIQTKDWGSILCKLGYQLEVFGADLVGKDLLCTNKVWNKVLLCTPSMLYRAYIYTYKWFLLPSNQNHRPHSHKQHAHVTWNLEFK